MKGIETEVKIALLPSEVRRIRPFMTSLCNEPKKIIEVTALYDDKNLTFLREGKTLRIRVICSPIPSNTGLKVQSASLDYKGSSFGGKINRRVEMSAPISNLQILYVSRMIRSRGLDCIYFYTKKKEEWSFLETKISIDNLFMLGNFLEVEGDERQIEAVLSFFNFSVKERISKTTYQLYGRFFEIYGGVPSWLVPSIKFV